MDWDQIRIKLIIIQSKWEEKTKLLLMTDLTMVIFYFLQNKHMLNLHCLID